MTSPQQSVESKIRSACGMGTREICRECNGDGFEFPIGSPLYDKREQCPSCEGKGALGEDETIQLQHVLRAIHPQENMEGFYLEMDANGAMRWRKQFEGSIFFTSVVYDLTRPFSEQSEELYRFLDEILK